MNQQQRIIPIGRGLASGERTRESPINSRYLWIFGLGIALAMLAVLVVFVWEGLKIAQTHTAVLVLAGGPLDVGFLGGAVATARMSGRPPSSSPETQAGRF